MYFDYQTSVFYILDRLPNVRRKKEPKTWEITMNKQHVTSISVYVDLNDPEIAETIHLKRSECHKCNQTEVLLLFLIRYSFSL
jgi:hypothetical protein